MNNNNKPLLCFEVLQLIHKEVWYKKSKFLQKKCHVYNVNKIEQKFLRIQYKLITMYQTTCKLPVKADFFTGMKKINNRNAIYG